MIKRLKRKYTLIVMLAVIAVLGIIITVINIVSYSAVNAQLDEKLAMIIDNEGKMPDFPPPEIPSVEDETDGTDDPSDKTEGDGEEQIPDGPATGETGAEGEEPPSDTPDGEGNEEETPDEGEGKDEEDEEDVLQSMSPETPFETRFFTVKLDTAGTVTDTDIAKVVAVDEALAQRYAREVFLGGKDVGYISTYRFMRRAGDDGVICVFIDANRELESVRSFVLSSVVISLAGILLVCQCLVVLRNIHSTNAMW